MHHKFRGQQAHSILFPAISTPNPGSYVIQGSIKYQIFCQSYQCDSKINSKTSLHGVSAVSDKVVRLRISDSDEVSSKSIRLTKGKRLYI